MKLKMSTAFAAAAMSATVFTASPALAGPTLTFEGQSNAQYGAPITRSGFTIGNPVGQEQHFHEIDSTQFGLASNGTGVLLNDRDTQIFLSAIGGDVFTLTSFDIAAAFGSNPGNTYTVTAFLGAATVGTLSGNLGQFATINGFGNTSLDRVVFDGIGGGGGFELDNIVLNGTATGAVPEPATWAMMLVGFGAIGGALRRRQKVATRIRFA